MMKISVIVPTYKRPALLLRCIEALHLQEFPTAEYEIVIVSDGPDLTTQLALDQIKKGGPMLRFLSLPSKRGPAAARNLGWQSAVGQLIAFTDDDCIPHSRWLESFCNTFSKLSEKKVAFTGKTIVPIPTKPSDYELNISHLATAEFITANCACTPDALQSVNGFDERFTMAWREDSDLQFKFIEQRIPIIAVDAHVTHPVRKAPWGVSIKDEKKGIFNALLYKKFPQLYKAKIHSSAPWHYYTMIFLILLSLIGVATSSHTLAMVALAFWFLLILWFTTKRLSKTKRDLNHATEMFITSMIIPFLSVFYRIYGAIKFKSPLLP
jgi:glycosyltransferase involved in cell wall biosynthesis